jgi:acid phosphatase (class A)
MNKKLLILFFASFLIGKIATAKPYFTADLISPTLLTPPTKQDSAESKKEIAEIIELQKNPDPNEIIQAEKEVHYTPETLVLAVDEKMSRERFVHLYNLLDRVAETSQIANDRAKEYWNTKRPYLLDKRVKALIEAHSNPAYPSGHTCGSFTTAHVMGLILPQKRDEFYARAQKIAWHRVIVGMHFPSDVKGGKEMALLVIGGLLQNAEFQQDLVEVKKEF